MPRFQYGERQVYWTPSFTDGVFSVALPGRSSEDPVPVLDFTRLTSTQMLCVMRQERVWVPRGCRKAVVALSKLACQSQREALYEAGIYQYMGLADAVSGRDNNSEAEVDGDANDVDRCTTFVWPGR